MHSHKRHWILLVWLTIAFFIFPLTPPISYHMPFEQNSMGDHTEAPVIMHLESSPSRTTIISYPSSLPMNDTSPQESFYFYLLLLVIFLTFVRSKIYKILKRHLLAILTFSSVFISALIQIRIVQANQE